MALNGGTVAVFALGGTIAATGDPDTGAVIPALSAKELLGAVPALTALGVELRVHDVRRLPSASLRFADLDELHRRIAQELDGGDVDGVVVVQGTDTIEEASFHLDLLHRGDAPIVFTGAMRNPTLPGADGPANLYAAVLAAAGPWLRGAGCVVVLNDEVHAARTVRKSHTTSTAAFTSPGSGPIALVAEGRVRMLHGQPRRTALPAEPGRADTAVPPDRTPRIVLHTVTLDDDTTVLDLYDGVCDGLVLAALGGGHVPEWMVPSLRRLARRIPVVLASRAGCGPVLTRAYGYPGSEQDVLAAGLIPAGDLDPYKARLLLRHLLATGRTDRTDRTRIAAAFAAHGASEA